MNVTEQIDDFEKLTHDCNRWSWVFEINKLQIEQCEKQTLLIIMDNDITMLIIGDIEGEHKMFKFDEHAGQTLGLVEIFSVLRVNCEFA